MPADPGRIASLLRERSTAIVARALATSPDGPIKPTTTPEGRAFWDMAGARTMAAIVEFLENGNLPGQEEVRPGASLMSAAGISLAEAMAAKTAFCREVGREVEGSGGDASAVLAAVEAAERVIAVPLGDYVRHLEGSLNSERAGLLSSLDAFDVVVFRAAMDSRLLAVNQAGARVLGAASPVELVGRRFAEFYADPAEREQLRARLMEDRAIHQFRFRLRRLDGALRWCETNMRVVAGPDGRGAGLEGFARDITAAVEAGEALQRSEDRYRRLVENLRREYIFYSHDTDGVFTYVSPSVTDVLGFEPGEFLTHYAEYLPDTPLNRQAQRHTELSISGRQQPPYELETRHKDGRLVRLEITEVPVLGPDGRVVAVEGLGHDITERQRAENELRRSEERYRDLVENINDIIYTVDAAGTVTYVSHAAERLLGYPPAEAVGRKFAEFIVQEDLPLVAAEFAKGIAGDVTPSSFRMIAKSGQVRWVRTSTRPMIADGQVVGLHGLLSDITPQVEAERARQRTGELLDKLPICAFEIDGEDRIRTMNANGLRMVRATDASQVIDRKVTDFYAVPGAEPAFSEQVRASEEGVTTRMQVRRLDGTTFWAEGFARAVRNAAGEVVGREGFLRDISALLESEAARERMRQLVDKLPIGAFEMDRDSVILSMSAGGLAMIGAAEPSEVVGHKVTDFYADPSEEAAVKAKIESQGQLSDLRLRLRRLDGSLIWVESMVRAVRDESGTVVGREGFIRDVTALVKVERALEAERQRLDQVVRSVGAGLCLLDRDLRIVWANDLLLKVSGPMEKIAGRRCHEVFACAEHPCQNCPALKTLRDGDQCVADVPVSVPDGPDRIVRLTTSPVRDESGQVVQILELAQDITAERAAEVERERTASMLAGILSSAGEYAIVATDPQGTIGYFSDGAERLFGVASSGPVGRLNIADLWTPEARPGFAAQLADLANGGRYEEEGELLRAQGLTFTARISGSARRDAAGGLAGFTFVIRDVTEERAAQKLVGLLAHAVESSREGMALTDMSGVITYVNPAIATMTGRDTGALLGKDVSILYSHDTPGEDIRAIARATLAGGWNGEVTGVRADGATYPAYMTTSLVRDEHGRAVAMVGLWRDVSREKSLQKRLFEQEQRHLAELERQVRERTAELERAYRDLQKLDAMKDRFLTNVSHELRTPLVSGVGYIELILHEGLGPINDETRKGLRVAHRNLLRLVNLIDDLLTFTRLGSGRESMVRTRFDLGGMINDCLLDLKVRASKKSLRVEMDVEKGLPPVEADEENVHRVLTNLLSNSEKFTGDDALIGVRARRVSEAHVEVRVSDNGVGIPEDELGQVFDRFYRSQRTSSPRYGGTGIGLSLVKEILEAHGCAVRAENTAGGGTTIVFTLPLAAAAATTAPAAAPGPSIAPPGRPRGSSAILVIDDDPDVHDLLGAVLKDTGASLTSARNGAEGLATAATDDFDLIFLDLSMEGMDGTEVLKRLRGEERSRHTPVYVLTARADDDSLRQARSAGAQGLLVKPFSISEVREVLNDVMSGGESRRDSGRLPKIT